MTGEELDAERPWIPCHFLRHAGQSACVIRLDTGTILQIGLSSSIDVTRACMICALKPVPACIRWGPDNPHEGCELAIQWPEVPAPARFTRTKKISKPPAKRQKKN
jgi:hypothetical protein